ncbi:MAG TPA: sugar transferase [Rhizomicrobium sp.]|jgi:putative colanic acid biosynthesis UDP-glucose lipid carrier transferase
MPEQTAEKSDWAAVADSAAARPPAVLRLVPPTKLPVEWQSAPDTPAYRIAKRCLDLAAAFILFVLIAPLLLAAAAAIRFESAGPALFRQWRLGRNGKPFRILKLRTLTVVEDHVFRQVTRDDSRLTRIGRVLRKLSIDELPQLLNVIRGEMSLVGPRPHAIAHDHYYGERIDGYTQRQNVKPGITGWAQIHGFRGETATLDDMRARVRFDLWYVRHADFLLDLRILLATPRAVLGGRNAH